MRKSLKLFLVGFTILFSLILLMNSQVFAASVQVPDTSSTKTTQEQLQEAVDAGSDVVLTENITNLTGTITISKSVTIDGDGHSIEVSTFKKVFEIKEGADVTFKNITIKNTFAGGRCIDTRSGSIKLTLDNAYLETTTTSGNSHDQTLNVGGNLSTEYPDAIEIVVKNASTITAGKSGYAIMTWNPVNLTIDNSEITGYAALYMRESSDSAGSAGSVVNIVNGSVLHGKNEHSNATNAFATIAIRDGNIQINVEDSELKATGTGDQIQFVFDEEKLNGASTVSNKITIEGNSTITSSNVASTEDVETSVGQFETETSVTVEAGVKSNVEIPEIYLPEGIEFEKDEDGNYKKDADGNMVLVTIKYKVTIDNKEYTVETGKTVKDIAEYNDIIKKEGYEFLGFQTEDGKEYDETTKIEKDIVLKTVFKLVEDEKDEDLGNTDTEKDEGQEDEKEEKPKDDTPKTGVESMTHPVFALVAVISLAGIIINRKK